MAVLEACTRLCSVFMSCMWHVCKRTCVPVLHGRFYNGQLADDKCVLSQNRAATWHVEEYLGPYAFIDCEDGLVCLLSTSFL